MLTGDSWCELCHVMKRSVKLLRSRVELNVPVMSGVWTVDSFPLTALRLIFGLAVYTTTSQSSIKY